MEEALEEVLPEECRSLDAYVLDPPARRMMLNSEDPLLSSSPRDFAHQRPIRRQNRLGSSIATQLQWQSDNSSLQVRVRLATAHRSRTSRNFTVYCFHIFYTLSMSYYFSGVCRRSRYRTSSVPKPKQRARVAAASQEARVSRRPVQVAHAPRQLALHAATNLAS